MSAPLLLAIPDLALSSRVAAAARKCGVAAIATLTLHDLLSKAHGEEARLLLLDLGAEQFPPSDIVAALKSDEHTSTIRIVGFHDGEGNTNAPCDVVLSRTALLQNLEALLRDLQP